MAHLSSMQTVKAGRCANCVHRKAAFRNGTITFISAKSFDSVAPNGIVATQRKTHILRMVPQNNCTS